MKAAILAIGTELTTGQITNRNAAWLSHHLDSLGAQVVMHLTVADDRPNILNALNLIAASADLLLVTGGLGPTSDDFTREVIAKWTDSALVWHEPSWKKIEQRLGALNIRVVQSNRQQCYFPERAQVINNSEGTADAFYILHSAEGATKHLWVLPGPPREIEALWNDSISDHLVRLLPAPERRELLLWQLLGKSEAEVGEITEAALKGTGLLTGYRAHRPYVEVKVWAPLRDQRTPNVVNALERLDQALKPWTVLRGKPEFHQRLWQKLAGFDDILMIDQLTQGLLAESLFPLVRANHKPNEQEFVIHTCGETTADHLAIAQAQLDAMDPETLGLVITGFDVQGQFSLGMSQGGRRRLETLQSPWKLDALHGTLKDRAQRFAAETALRLWGDWIPEN